MILVDFGNIDFDKLKARYGEFWIFGEHLYYEPMLDFVCFDRAKAKRTFIDIQKMLSLHKNSFAVGFVSYELGILEYGLDFHLDNANNKADFKAFDYADFKNKSKIPLIFFRLFSKRIKLAKLAKSNHKSSLKIATKSSANFIPTILQKLDKSRYAKDFNAIKNALKNGETYQINYTQELHLQSRLNGLEIFSHLLSRQNTKYKAFLQTPFVEIASFSPELFLRLKGRKIKVEPMKGTMPRNDIKSKDKANKKALQNDEKNVAENMMIVDLLRNDLHKIAHNLRYKLLQIKSYKTLHQMTSKITAFLRKQTILDTQKNCLKLSDYKDTLYEIFCALFPCGSISGAPKKSSLEIIKKLEKRERGIYCGAIGVITQKNKKREIHTNKKNKKHTKQTQNLKATFSVPIRTLFRKQNENFWRYGVGSGVVWDSILSEEIAELELKSSFLFRQDFALIETMLIKNNRAFLLEAHLARMLKSAKDLGFNFLDLQKFGLENIAQNKDNFKPPILAKNISDFMRFNPLDLITTKTNAWQNLPPKMLQKLRQNLNYKNNKNKPKILRMLLHKNGEIKIEILPFTQIKSSVIKIAKNKLNSRNDALYHKSTLREHFTQIPTGRNNIFDFIYLNENGEICEGSRSNIVILAREKNGVNLYTPSQKSGLLNGVLRKYFLRDKIVREKVLKLQDLQNAEKIFCINSVRGVQEVFLK